MYKAIIFFLVILFSSQLSYSAIVDTTHVWGLTIDDISNLSGVDTALARLCKKPTTRIVFDEQVAATYYQTAVNQIHNYSFIMGELLDSYYMNTYNLTQYVARANEYLNLLGGKVDIWEVGNEVNGEWCGTTADVAAKIDSAYAIFKAANKKTELTLYYNKDCWSNSKNEMFCWVNKNISARMRNGLDYVFVSYYEDDCNNLQPNWQQVFDSLHVLFPNSKLGMGECGTVTAANKAAFINRYYKMNITTPKYVGGYFWWYWYEDCMPYTKALWTTFNNAIANNTCPGIQASNVTYTTLSPTSVSLSWTNGNGMKKAVFMLDGSAGTPTMTDGCTYVANATFGLGPQAGAGWYCVYNGPTVSSITVNGLISAHTYRAMVLEYNGNPGFEGYNTTTATNNPINLLSAMPVELVSFTSSVTENTAILKWVTATEINNAGFNVERTISGSKDLWREAGYVKGKGNSTSAISYEFKDNNLAPGKYKYRLRQTDFNGNFQYYNLSGEVQIGVPAKYDLSQNYPNPFNPMTKISYALPQDGFVTLKIYDVVGREVKTLVNEFKKASSYSIDFNASELTSGVYYYKLSSENFSSVKKMLLIK